MPDLISKLEKIEGPDREMCEHCEGKGWYWRTPDVFNPFLARVECRRCSIALLRAKEAQNSALQGKQSE